MYKGRSKEKKKLMDKEGSTVQELISPGNCEIVSSQSVAVLLSCPLEHLLG